MATDAAASFVKTNSTFFLTRRALRRLPAQRPMALEQGRKPLPDTEVPDQRAPRVLNIVNVAIRVDTQKGGGTCCGATSFEDLLNGLLKHAVINPARQVSRGLLFFFFFAHALNWRDQVSSQGSAAHSTSVDITKLNCVSTQRKERHLHNSTKDEAEVQNEGWHEAIRNSLNMWTVCDTLSPESITMPGVRLEAHRDKSVWIATFMAGTLNVSTMVCVMRSRLARKNQGHSVSRTGCSRAQSWVYCPSRWLSCVSKQKQYGMSHQRTWRAR